MAEYGYEWDVVDEAPFDAAAYALPDAPVLPQQPQAQNEWDVVDELPADGYEPLPTAQPVPQSNPDGSYISDLGHLVGSGLDQLGVVLGKGIGLAGFDDAGKYVQDLYRGREKQQYANLTPEMQASMEKKFLESDAEGNVTGIGDAWTDYRTITGQAAQSLPSMAAGSGLGLAATKGLIGLGIKGLSSGAAGVIGGAVGEGGVAAAVTSSNVYDDIMAMPEEALHNSPEYQSLLQSMGPQEARETLAKSAAAKAGVYDFAATAALGAPSGHFMGKLIGGEGKNLWNSVGKGALLEGLQEFPQSGAEQYIQNVQMGRADPSISPMKGVWESAVQGGVLGPLMGGMEGAGGHVLGHNSHGGPDAQGAVRAIRDLVGDNQHVLLDDAELASAEKVAAYLAQEHPSKEVSTALQAIQAEREARAAQAQQAPPPAAEEVQTPQAQAEAQVMQQQAQVGLGPFDAREPDPFVGQELPQAQQPAPAWTPPGENMDWMEEPLPGSSPVAQHIAQGGGVDLLSGKPVGYGLRATSDAPNMLTPEEQARADAIRLERETPPPALPQGQGFELVGQPQDFSQAETASIEAAGIPAVDENAPDGPMPAADSAAFDRSDLKSEADLIRDYQAGAIQEADARGSELLKFVRGRLNGQSVANHFGSSVLEDLRGRLGPGAFSKNGVAWDVLEAEAKSQGLLSQDASLVDSLQNVLPAKRKTQEQAARGIINGQMEQDGYAAPMGDARQEPAPLPSDRMGIPEAEGLAPLNSDGTLRGDGPRYSVSSRKPTAENWRGHTIDDLKRAFPKSRIVETDTGHRIDLPNRRALLVDRAGFIQIDPEAARRGGYSEEAIAKAVQSGAKGQFNMVDGTGVIQLTEAGREELGHEVMHFARVAALTAKQNALLDRKYGKDARDADHREELIAQAYNSWLNKRGPDSTGMFAPILKFFRNIRQAVAPTAEGVFEKTASGQVWSQKGQQGTAGPQYALAYHGSPHRGIEQFNWEKHRLTGEGAAAYGEGTYLGGEVEVAKSYMPRDMKLEEKLQGMYSQAERRGDYTLMEVLESAMLHETPAELQARYGSEDYGKEYKAAADKVAAFIKKNAKKGQLYEVDIPEADELLDWDKPLSEQPAGVREAIQSTPYWRGLMEEQEAVNKQAGYQYMDRENSLTGEKFYHMLELSLGSAEKASQYLRDAGLPGHRYLDGMSRDKGEGSHNFVIYDDSRAKITKTFYSIIDGSLAPGDFVEHPNGGKDFGFIPQEIAGKWNGKAAPIRLVKGDSRYGAVHIEQRHGGQIKGLGYTSVSDFVAHVIDKFDAVFQGKGKSVTAVVRSDKPWSTAELNMQYVEDGDYYSVTTALPRRSTYFKWDSTGDYKKELLWEGAPSLHRLAATPGALTGQSNLSAENSAGNKVDAPAPGVKDTKPVYSLPASKEEQLAQARERLAKAMKGTIIRPEDGIAADPAKIPLSKDGAVAWLRKQYQDYVDQYAPVLREAGKLSPEAKADLQNKISFLRGGGGAVDVILTGKGEIFNYANADPSKTVPGSKSLAAVLELIKGDQQMIEAFDLLLKGERHIALAKYRPEIARKDYLADRKYWLEALKDAPNPADRKLIREHLKALKTAFVRQVKGVDAAYWSKRIPEVETTLGPEKTAKVRQAMKDYRAFLGHAVLDRLAEAGTLSQEAYKAIKNAPEHEWYAPMQRQMDQIEQAQAQFVGHADVIKRLKGSLRNTLPAVESAIAYVDRSVRLVAQNNVAKAFLAVRDANPDLAQIIKEVKVDPARVSGERYIRVIEDGKKRFFEAPKEFVQALNGITPQEANLFKQIMALPAKALRFGATMSLEFPVRNFMRDQWSAMINSNYGYMPFADALNGMAKIWFNNPIVEEWKAAGGDQAYFTSLDRAVKHVQAKELMGMQEKGLIRYFKNPKELAGAIAEGLRGMSDFAEKWTRVGLYANARKKGATPGAAATEARMSTLDFGRMGLSGRGINSIIAFWNANVQDVDILARNLRDKPGRTLAKIALGVTLPSVLLWAAQHDDDRYKSTPQWLKDTFWVIYPWWDKEAKVPMILPKPFLMGALFGSSVEHMLDYAVDKKRDGLKDAVRGVIAVGVPGFMPTIASPILEWWTNYSFFRGRSLESQSDQKLPPSMRASTQTQEVFKKLGNMLDVSPIKLENTMRGYTGNLGLSATAVVSAGIEAVDGKARPTPVAKRLTEQPGIKAVFGREPIGSNSQQVADFYDNLERASQAEAGFKVLAESGDKAALAKFRKENLPDISMAKALKETSQKLGEKRKSIAAIQKHPTMAPEAKRQRLDQLNREMTKIAGQANAVYEKRKAK